MKEGFNSPFYYGCLASALSLATYNFSGGAFNLAMLMGGIVYDNVLDIKYIGLFCGSLFGALIGQLFRIIPKI